LGHLQRLIAFDLDGTLVDSRRDLADAANDLITERGGMPLSEDAIARMVGEGAALLVRRALTAARITDTGGALARFLEIYDTRLLNHTRVYEGMDDAVRLARTFARVAILTNKPLAPTERILDGLGLRELFDDVTGGDGPLGRKPDPASLHALMRAAGATASHTLLVGDSAIDHETAVRAGVRCCLVSFGFGHHNFDRSRLRREDRVAASAEELRGVIAQFANGRP
jgi:phosphoglycolate phosphatase